MTTPAGVFKNATITVTVSPDPKLYDDLVGPNGQLKSGDLSAFFNRSLAESIGKVAIKNADSDVELACTFTYAKNLLTVTDPSGNKSVFAFANKALYFLDPTGNSSMILRQAG
jgi:hypothetical protein